ncbi:mitochondrial ribonuclease P catalytic subunit isoform X2 [Heptranchias perlo]|uniref:mitochondrial ribonuclease P catalytic subunit isoform X2 n=1 Tax=Heptranchias perlo TaxID=212740 RepID=UPI00355A2BF2
MLPQPLRFFAPRLQRALRSVGKDLGASMLLPCCIAPQLCTSSKFLMLTECKQNDGDKRKTSNAQQERVTRRGDTGSSFSLFTAGAARKRAEFTKSKKGNKLPDASKVAKLSNTSIPIKPLSIDEWKKLKAESYNKTRFEISIMEKLLSARADVDVAKSLLVFVTMETGTVGIPGDKWEGHVTTIVHSGKCHVCNTLLESIQLSEEEYSILRECVMNDVIQGKDVFKKTTPLELQHFQTFVKNRQPFDVVIDGLNVANISAKVNQSRILLDVVSHLAQQNLRLLVLGRKHMLRGTRSWDKGHMAAIQKYADCFFTANISEDDPFLLYATIHSGNHCKFLSRDLMRDHKACLSDKDTRRLFFKWQRGHQLVLSRYNPGHKMKFEIIPKYDTIVQTTKNTWHIPYDEEGVERCSYEVPHKWLCLQKQN